MGEAFTDSIVVNNEDVGRQAAQRLIEAGHKKIAIICGKEPDYTATLRKKGFVKQAGNIPKEYVLDLGGDERAGYEGAKKLLSLKDPPTGIFSSNYYITIGLIKAFNELNFTPGKEVSVIAMDSLSLTPVLKPSLTVIAQPYDQIAENASKLLIKRIKEGVTAKPTLSILNVETVEGESIARIN